MVTAGSPTGAGRKTMGEFLIKGGSVLDGLGAPPVDADVLISGDRIVAVRQGIEASAGIQVIDASGACVTPGFIDIHTHYDPLLFSDPLVEMAEHGITTILIGNCSLGLAPLRPNDRQGVADIFSYIENIPQDVFSTLIPWTWQTYAEYTSVLAQGRYAANVLALVSHSLLRQYVMGAEAWTRAATAEEADAIAEELDAALRAGAAGMSSSRHDRDRDARPVPSYFADDHELDRLLAVLGRHGRVLQVIPRQPEVAQACGDLGRY